LFLGHGDDKVIDSDPIWGNRQGLVVLGNDNFIGGEAPGAGNLISGNEYVGLAIAGERNQVAGNFIGTDVTGTVANGNRRGALVISGKSNVIGTDAADGFAAANVIAGNLQTGVSLTSTTTNNVVAGNFIGVDSSGFGALPNGQDGILVQGANNVIGGLAPNVISGNTRDGIRIDGGAARANRVESNFIGTDAMGVAPLGNGGDGVRITGGKNNAIGSTALGVDNVIAFNAGAGVCVASGNGNAIRRNAIFTNTGRGIKLTGQGNLAQQAPALATAVFDVSAGSLTIAGGLLSARSTQFTVEFFANSPGDPEGRTYLGSTIVRTDGRGRALVAATFTNVLLAAGDLITATATSSLDNTSEFSTAIAVVTQ
jgi:titin